MFNSDCECVLPWSETAHELSPQPPDAEDETAVVASLFCTVN
jgi:hypothetical protein